MVTSIPASAVRPGMVLLAPFLEGHRQPLLVTAVEQEGPKVRVYFGPTSYLADPSYSFQQPANAG